MIRLVLVLLLLTQVNTEMRSVVKSVYVSRKSRSNSAPVESGYMYSQVDNDPGTLAVINDYPAYNKPYHIGDIDNYPIIVATTTTPINYPPSVEPVGVYTEPTPYVRDPRYVYNHDYEKSKHIYDSGFLPSKLKTDAMYEELKSIMHYKHPDSGESPEVNYDNFLDYNHDEDDIRTSSRSSYDSWPFYYHAPYEYEYNNVENGSKRSMNTRITPGDVKPVYENVDDIPLTNPSNHVDTADRNPLKGNQPFFSVDYNAKNSNEDSLDFKGLDWSKDIDKNTDVIKTEEKYGKRDRRRPYAADYNHAYKNRPYSYVTSNASSGDSATEKGYTKNKEFDKQEQANDLKENHKTAYENSAENNRGYKDFIDTFSNNVGGEEFKKDSKYVLHKDQDKGAKRKGFRRVYHKDEYQEDNEFYDNNNNKAQADEKGSLSVHRGGSNAVLQSHAAAAAGNDRNAYKNQGDIEKNMYANNHKGHDYRKGLDNDFHRYHDVAKNAALSNSNNGDYYDFYSYY